MSLDSLFPATKLEASDNVKKDIFLSRYVDALQSLWKAISGQLKELLETANVRIEVPEMKTICHKI